MTPSTRHILIILAFGCSDYDLWRRSDAEPPGDEGDDAHDDDATPDVPEACDPEGWPTEEVGIDDTCAAPSGGGFNPVVEWEYDGEWGTGCLSLPSVGDLDGDGLAEIVINVTDLFASAGELVVLNGDGSGVMWSDTDASIGYAASPALADLDGDGTAEVLVAREYASSMWMGEGDYTVVAYGWDGAELWESDHFTGTDFGYTTGLAVSDMDHDGSPEVVAGRVILDSSGGTRGVGSVGSGSNAMDGALPAVADLDLDGTEEVITGNAMYGPDAELLWSDPTRDDGYVSIANLDDDPEGEFIVVSGDTIRAHDTNGAILWGPDTYTATVTLSVAAVADLDLDGAPEIVFAGSNRLHAIHADGTPLWTATVTDETGATGASVFDFEGDGYPEVVYVDETSVSAYVGATGELKFRTDEHSSNTMFDYPVIADVDDDGQAEVVVCHNGYDTVMSVYGDADSSWAPARPVWNQHAYSISNVSDDLSIPVDPTPGFVDTNTWHSAIAVDGHALDVDVSGEITEVCTDDCDDGVVWVTARLLNVSTVEVEAGLALTLYARIGGAWDPVSILETSATVPGGWASDGFVIAVDAADLAGATALRLVVDDDGTGTGALSECSESNNAFEVDGPFCE